MAGMYYEDFVVGEVIRHEVTRTVTESDNLLITTLTMNVQPLHLDAEFSGESIFGRQIVNSIFTLGLVTGIPVQETTLGTTLGNLGFREISFPKPVFFGDTLRVETEALDKRESNSRPGTGLVGIEHRGYNQNDELVCTVRRTALMKCRPS
ncbi:MaoC family dehydratase [Pseudoglutamicibacter albus]|uniref:Acyl dehydratase n=1 Tax=Pseudoglutamicibacter albus TaxID=98671 RepID=A0ABU1YWW9_9MICC|nr:MaoC family dehydratase [Pseudoglutamicibacter albus]MDR7292841.1 acyl dehydratase [Pseudoglutamicibacter albus]